MSNKTELKVNEPKTIRLINIKRLLILFAAFTLSSGAFAQQDSSGIYKTADDFQNRKLSYAINYKTEKHKIRDNLLFNNDEIKVKHDGTTYTLPKSTTYGYRDTKGQEYRFIDDKEYSILNPGEQIIIYKYVETKAGKGNIKIDNYFFSTEALSAPQSLTIANIKAAFPENHKFHDALDAQFKTDNDLKAYDSFHKMYKLNHILQESLK